MLGFGLVSLNFWVSAELDEGANRLSTTLRGQPLIDYLGAHLHVYYVRSAAGVDVVLTNSGPLDIPPGSSWSIYFSQAGKATDSRRPLALSSWQPGRPDCRSLTPSCLRPRDT